MAPEQDILSGIIERVTYHQPDSGFCVLQIKVPGKKDLVPLIGQAPSVSPGEYVTAHGRWAVDREYGRQFRAESLRIAPPNTASGMEKYLGSGMVKGIGPVYAARLVAAFGTDVFEIIERDPLRLREIEGIGPQRASRIAQAWHDQQTIRTIMIFLHGHGVSTSQAVRIFKTYGEEAIAKVQENPYRLARDIRGIGFKSADKIASHLGVETTSPLRIRAGVTYALSEAAGNGHCGLPQHELVSQTAQLLSVPASLVPGAIAQELSEGAIVSEMARGEICIFLSALAYEERAIARRLQTLMAGPVPWPEVDLPQAIAWAAEHLHLTLAQSQKEAVCQALTSKVLVITGGPGVGKTTIVNTILSILRTKQVVPLLAAPTGRAAKRLAETTGLEARTIHRLLEFQPPGGFRHDEHSPLAADLIIVDEVSMLDVPLMYHLMQAISPQSALILVGDVDQIPSVGPGQVLRDILDSGAVPVVRLTEVFRQAANSGIVVNAHRINHGLLPLTDPHPAIPQDFYWVPSPNPADTAAKIVELVTNRIPRQFHLDPVRDIQVLCPMNRGETGARSLNATLQQALNPATLDAIERYGWRFGVGDKVMQLQNDYEKEVFNGDIGWITAIRPDDQELIGRFDGRDVIYDFSDLDMLVPAYATTIHKAQGSEYPAVVIPVTMQHYLMLKRNLIYTAVTRGKQLVILIGQPNALAVAVRTQASELRWSKLGEWLSPANTEATMRRD